MRQACAGGWHIWHVGLWCGSIHGCGPSDSPILSKPSNGTHLSWADTPLVVARLLGEGLCDHVIIATTLHTNSGGCSLVGWQQLIAAYVVAGVPLDRVHFCFQGFLVDVGGGPAGTTDIFKEFTSVRVVCGCVCVVHALYLHAPYLSQQVRINKGGAATPSPGATRRGG